MPREGRDRSLRDGTAFGAIRAPLAEVVNEHSYSLSGGANELSCVVDLRTASLRWFDGRGRQFASDLQRRAYARDLDSEQLVHFTTRHANDTFLGLVRV